MDSELYHSPAVEFQQICILRGFESAHGGSEAGVRCGGRAICGKSFGSVLARWDKKYPKISASWRENWPNLSTYFKFPKEFRRLIYAANAIEGFNRQFRKVTKAKAVFPTDDSLLKMLYLAMLDITKKSPPLYRKYPKKQNVPQRILDCVPRPMIRYFFQ